MKRRYAVVLSPTQYEDEVGFTVTVPALPGCITEGDTLDEALTNAREVLTLFVESLDEGGLPVPPSDADLPRPLSDDLVTSIEIETAEVVRSR